MAFELSENSYGKSKVRMTKVVRDSARHELFEFDVDLKLAGDFAAAYEVGDNTQVIATDTIKNTVYVLAKQHAFDSPETFALLLASHFVQTYTQVKYAFVEIKQTPWRRIDVSGAGHDHAFTRDGTYFRIATGIFGRRHDPFVHGGVKSLEVLKTTASEWRDFHADKYRTLKDTRDRILATTVDASWIYDANPADYNSTYARATTAILATFANQHSLGAQHTIKAMGDAVLIACPEIRQVDFTLPNQHRIPFNLDPFGLKFENDIFVATSEPFGEIQGTVTRKTDLPK